VTDDRRQMTDDRRRVTLSAVAPSLAPAGEGWGGGDSI
jgi:hypothetical protein